LAEPGWMGTIGVYTLAGQKIRTLTSNTLLGTNEYLTWDGRDNAGNISEIGLYLLYGELFHSSGEVKNFKKVVPVVRK